MSMPGTPIIYYGDEIGMGDNIYLGDRNGVRTPMQWNGGWNAGFSGADPERLYSPLISNPVYGYQAINVEAQKRLPHSLLSWMKRLIEVRKSTQVFSRGSIEFLRPSNHRVLAYVRQLDDQKILVVNNLSSSAQAVELDLQAIQGQHSDRDVRQEPFPAHRGFAVSTDAGAVSILLVPPAAFLMR